MNTQERRLRRVYLFIARYTGEHQCSPSYRDISKACGVPNVTLQVDIQRLNARGWIRHEPYTNRAIALTGAVQVVKINGKDCIVEVLS